MYELKNEQESVFQFASEKDIFVCLITGYGKSLCYEILPMIDSKIWTRPFRPRAGDVPVLWLVKGCAIARLGAVATRREIGLLCLIGLSLELVFQLADTHSLTLSG